ncbi:hypothetical protein AB1Y20_016482 [Prymnesium parvum]|uniref:Ribosomal RNA-processing protein 43 n=1 Tax=Prymnesium parvum TaxID=97485 RepID=A0AB34IFB9_PRYPA
MEVDALPLFRSTHRREFHDEFLRAGVRPDGRRPLEARVPRVQRGVLSSAHGSARVGVGKTLVLAGVRAELTAPRQTEPSRGRVLVALETTNISGPSSASALLRSADEHAAVVELLQRTASGGLVELDRLCAVKGSAVWTLYCDVYVLEHDGNITDAAMLAMCAALGDVQLPLVEYDEKLESFVTLGPACRLTESESTSPTPGTLKRKRKAEPSEVIRSHADNLMRVKLDDLLLPFSFGVLSGHLLADPCRDEESLLSCNFTVLVHSDGQFASLHKPGGAPLSEHIMETAINASRNYSNGILQKLRLPF